MGPTLMGLFLVGPLSFCGSGLLAGSAGLASTTVSNFAENTLGFKKLQMGPWTVIANILNNTLSFLKSQIDTP